MASCGHPALWRCLSCNARPTFCTNCCRETHHAHPLHRVEFWGGTFYRSAWLRQVGVQVHCGHNGSPCPALDTYDPVPPPLSSDATTADESSVPSLGPLKLPPSPLSFPELSSESDDENNPFVDGDPISDMEDEDADFYYASNADTFLPTAADLPWVGEGPKRPAPSEHTTDATSATYGNDRMIVVVDLEGIHELPFTFCACPNAQRDDIQLLDLGYYPASTHKPKTVFTARVLDDFLLSNKECKTSARNYFNKLRRSTNPAFPHMVPVSDSFDTKVISLIVHIICRTATKNYCGYQGNGAIFRCGRTPGSGTGTMKSVQARSR